MTREQAELIIKEEKLIDTDWYPSYKQNNELAPSPLSEVSE